MTTGSAPNGVPAADSSQGSIRLVGTAHVSHESVDRVEHEISEHDPDIVAVELDKGRYRQLQGEAPDDITAGDLLEGNTVFQLLAYWMLSYVQTKLGERFDIEPGADMRAAVETAEAQGRGLALVDRDIQTTIQRFWRKMTLREKVSLLIGLIWGMAGSVAGTLPEDEFDPDELTDADVVTAMMREFRQFSPGGAQALIDERDAYIAHNLLALAQQGNDVVAVIGAGHREGIQGYLEAPDTLPPMDDLTGTASRRFSVYRVVGYGIAIAYLTFFFLLAMAGLRDGFVLRLFLAWFLFNGIIAFSLAKLAGARWTSAGVGGAVAWLTSLNPLLAPGWFAGYVELRYRPVNVADISTLNEMLDDEERPLKELLSDMLEVPLFRLVAIVAMTNIGSMIATFLFPVTVLPYLAADIGGISGVGDRLLAGARESADVIWGLLE